MKFFKNPIFMFTLGIIISGCVAFAATQINANEIKYDNTHSVKDKIDDLYTTAAATIANLNSQISSLQAQSQSVSSEDLTPVLLWTNPTPTSAFGAQTISLDLSQYKYVLVVTKSSTAEDYKPRTSIVLPVLETYDQPISIATTGSSTYRAATANANGITFGNNSSRNSILIPYRIYGIKGELNIDIFE